MSGTTEQMAARAIVAAVFESINAHEADGIGGTMYATPREITADKLRSMGLSTDRIVHAKTLEVADTVRPPHGDVGWTDVEAVDHGAKTFQVTATSAMEHRVRRVWQYGAGYVWMVKRSTERR